MVFNKIDITGSEPKVIRDENGLVTSVWCSAHTGEGLDLLLDAVSEHLSRLHTACRVQLPASNGKLRAELYRKNVVKSESINEDGSFMLDCDLSPPDLGWLQKQKNITELVRL